MIQAWMVYRGYEIEKADEKNWRVIRNRELVHIAASAAEARAWIDGQRDRQASAALTRRRRK